MAWMHPIGDSFEFIRSLNAQAWHGHCFRLVVSKDALWGRCIHCFKTIADIQYDVEVLGEDGVCRATMRKKHQEYLESLNYL